MLGVDGRKKQGAVLSTNNDALMFPRVHTHDVLSAPSTLLHLPHVKLRSSGTEQCRNDLPVTYQLRGSERIGNA